MQLQNRFKYWLLKNTHYLNRTSLKQSVLEHTLLLEPRLFKVIDVSKACLYLIDINFTNYEHWFKTLVAINVCLSSNKQIDLHLLQLIKTICSVEYFFIDNAGLYLNASDCIIQYKLEVTKFLAYYKEIEFKQTGIDGYNKRILTQVLLALEKVTEQLREFSNGS